MSILFFRSRNNFSTGHIEFKVEVLFYSLGRCFDRHLMANAERGEKRMLLLTDAFSAIN